MLRDLHIKAVYRSDHDNILEDFYIPALSSSITYDRAVGYFSASMLSYAAQGLSAFVHNDGRMRLIVGGELDPEDVIAIQDGYDLRRIVERLNDQIVQAIERIDDSLFYRRFEILSWLVACGRLDIKIALKQRGMYHEKIGILGDSEGNRIVFQGSANETTHALLPDFNFESINVFQCWRSEFKDHFMPYIVGFEDLYVSREHAPLITPQDRMSSEAAELLSALIEHPDMAANLRDRLSKVPKTEITIIMDRLLEGARQEQEWGVPSILEACLVAAEADPTQGSRLSAFLAERPPAQIKPNIVPKIADQPWANGVMDTWNKSGEVSRPVKTAIKRQKEDGNLSI